MSELKPIAVRSFKNINNVLFETQTDNLNCEQVAAGYNGMIVDIAALRADLATAQSEVASMSGEIGEKDRVIKSQAERIANEDIAVEEFNAGFEAYRNGIPLTDEPQTTQDQWRVGWGWAAFADQSEAIRQAREQLNTNHPMLAYITLSNAIPAAHPAQAEQRTIIDAYADGM